jgi:hypothetical protein
LGYYSFIKWYYENEYPTDDLSTKLFARTLDYTFYLPYYLIIVCEKMKDYSTGVKMYTFIFKKMHDTLLAGEWWIKNVLFNLQFYDYSSLKKLNQYIQFLEKSGIKVNYDLDYLKKNLKCKLIYFSSSYVYSGLNKKIANEDDKVNPKHNFGIAKVFFENLILKNHKNSIILRLSSVFGEGKAFFPNTIYNFAKECLKDKKLTIWGSGNRKIQYIFIDDVAENTIKYFFSKPGIYNLAGKEYISIKKVSKKIAIFFKANMIFKKKRDGETLPFMNINRMIKFTKNYPSNFDKSLNKYLKSFKNNNS